MHLIAVTRQQCVMHAGSRVTWPSYAAVLRGFPWERSRSPTRRAKDKTEHTETKTVEEEQKVCMLFHLKKNRVKPLTVTVNKNGTTLTMEVVMSEMSYKHLWPVASSPPLKNTEVQLRTYSGEQLPALDQLSVNIRYKGKEEHLELVVISGEDQH